MKCLFQLTASTSQWTHRLEVLSNWFFLNKMLFLPEPVWLLLFTYIFGMKCPPVTAFYKDKGRAFHKVPVMEDANETPWQQWRRQGCCTERLWNQRMQIFYVEYDDQAEARATSSSRLDNSHWISFFTLQEEQSLCFLTAWQSIHLGQPRITFPSPFRVAGVGRSIITLF